jgi:nucleoid-associated protein YgaU
MPSGFDTKNLQIDRAESAIMKLISSLKLLTVSSVVFGVMVGCSHAPKKEEAAQPAAEAAPAAAPAPTGPSDEALSRALSRAANKVDQAKAVNAPGWQEAETSLNDAKAKMGTANGESFNLALSASRAADTAVNQYYLDQAKALMDKIQARKLKKDQKAAFDDVERSYLIGNGQEAFDKATALIGSLEGKKKAGKKKAADAIDTSTKGDYVVESGDTLWKISSKSDVYGDGSQWSRIFEANKEAIQDPNRIFPGQGLTIQH